MPFGSKDPNNYPIKKFESMLKTNRILFFDSDEFEDIVTHYLEIGKIALAKKATKLGLEQHPANTSLKLYQIEMLIFEDKLEIAERMLDELYMYEQGNEEVHIQKANICSRRNNHKLAIKHLEKALEITDHPADVYSLIGMEYLFIDDYANGLEYFKKCLEEDPEDYSALYNIIYCHDFLDQKDQAITFLNEYLDKNPYCEVAWHQLGKEYYDLEAYDKALAAFDFAIISDDHFVGAYLEKGRVLEKLKQYDKAIENYLITLSLNDPTSYALLRIGKCYEKLNNRELALQYYLKCTKEDALFDKGWTAITDLYYKAKQYLKALYYVEKAIVIDSENLKFWKRYAKINAKLQFYEEAEMGYRKSLELGSYDLDTWIKRGDLLLHLGEYDAAQTNFQQASEFYSDNVEIEYRLAGLYFSTKDFVKGEFYLREALSQDVDFLMIIEELFPSVYQMERVREIILQHKNPSL